MISHLAHVHFENRKRWGFVSGSQLQLIDQHLVNTADIMKARHELLAYTDQQRAALQHIALSELKILSPIVGNRRIICQGANYHQHMVDSGMDPAAKHFNMFFNKSSASICAASNDIIKPPHVSLLDYEIELGLVLAQDIDQSIEIEPADLADYIGGFVIANDVSARDIQIPETQFFKGKSYRTFCPLGPYLCLVNAESIHHLHSLNLQLSVNGELRQQDNTANLVFKPCETLSELTNFSNMEAGDLLLSGTPSGCALQLPSPFIVKLFNLLPETFRWRLFKKIQAKRPAYLQEGDVLEARIFSDDHALDLGCQTNKIVYQSKK